MRSRASLAAIRTYRTDCSSAQRRSAPHEPIHRSIERGDEDAPECVFAEGGAGAHVQPGWPETAGVSAGQLHRLDLRAAGVAEQVAVVQSLQGPVRHDVAA